jgi:diketogulonate reductase-like aldo/keto reductase
LSFEFVNSSELSEACISARIIEFSLKRSPLTRGKRLNHPELIRLGQKYNKSPAKILVRWSLQHDLIVIPKSSHEDRILENSKYLISISIKKTWKL